MRSRQWIGWGIGISILSGALSGAVIIAPAAANQSDISGTNVFNNTAIRYGFEPLSKAGLVTPLIQQVQGTITELLNSGGTSADTRTALIALSQRLTEINQERWAYTGVLDQTIQDASRGLAQDLTTASGACSASAQASPACERLSNLVRQTNTLLNNLENLRTSLIRSGQVSRIF